MSKLTQKAITLIEREVREALAAVTPQPLRAGVDTIVPTNPVEPEIARWRLTNALEWIEALKEEL